MITNESLLSLAPAEFENLVLDLVTAVGLQNAVWRTPGRDGGRDIEGVAFAPDLSGYREEQVWYVECKRHQSAISWPSVWEKLSYADVHSAHALLVVTTTSLSPQAVDQVQQWNAAHKRPLVRCWGFPEIARLLELHVPIAVKYGLSRNPREDAALAVLPVTRLLNKFTKSAESQREFGFENTRRLEVVFALSELIEWRLETIERSVLSAVPRFRATTDAYEWLDGAQHVAAVGPNRYVMRTIAAMLRDTTGQQRIIVERSAKGLLFKGTSELPRSSHSYLESISDLGNI